MLASIYKKIIEFKVGNEDSDHIIKRKKLVNFLAFIGSIIYLTYTIIFIVADMPLHASINFGACILTFGSYFLLSYLNNKNLAWFCIFYLLPFLGLFPFIYLYGNIGVEYYTFPLLIMYIFVESDRKKHYFYIASIFLFFLFSKLIIKYHPVGKEWLFLAEKFYIPNIAFSFILSSSFILIFKDEILKNHNKVKKFSDELEGKYIEEKQRLKQIEHLSKELNHRVKNNLQIISSLINLELSKDLSNDNNNILKDINNKIISLALVHQKLHQSDKGYIISLSAYASELIYFIVQSFNESSKIKTNLEIDELKINIEDAVHIGLILNELVTNAVKYGLTNKDLIIKLRIEEQDGHLNIHFKDNGRGFPKQFKIQENDSFGLGFINNLVQSYNGTIKTSNSNGAMLFISLNIAAFK